uniref:Uncharacterized protein n=1 Tax=Vibrio scophthalmi TaxID=45658 RepID=A0A024HV25_9VIBR|nr:hypothetical protein [Vibrio scophthalmi]
MGLFSWIEEVYDDLSGEKDRRRARYRAQTRVDAEKERSKLVKKAHKLWLSKDKKTKDALIESTTNSMIVEDILRQFSTDGHIRKGNTDYREELTKARKQLKFTDDLNIKKILEFAKTEYRYDNGIFYKGKEDDFVKMLDSFMRSELDGHKHLLEQWDEIHDKILSVSI